MGSTLLDIWMEWEILDNGKLKWMYMSDTARDLQAKVTGAIAFVVTASILYLETRKRLSGQARFPRGNRLLAVISYACLALGPQKTMADPRG